MNQSTLERAVYRIIIDAPIEDIWSELIDTSSPRPFFFNARCETPDMKPGQPYRMVSKNGNNVAVVGETLEMDPPHRLVQSFRFAHLEDPPCRVVYTLQEVAGGVEFKLITEDVPAGTKTAKSMAEGGVFITQNLKAWMETGKPTFGGRMILLLIALTAPFAPQSTRVENWPLDGGTRKS